VGAARPFLRWTPNHRRKISCNHHRSSGGATPGRARLNDLAGRSTALAPPCLLLCFASVIAWTENKNCIIISDRWPLYLFYFDSETISAALAAFVFWGRRLKKGVKKVRQLFWGKKCMTCRLEEILTSKWPGSSAALAPPLHRIIIFTTFLSEMYCNYEYPKG